MNEELDECVVCGETAAEEVYQDVPVCSDCAHTYRTIRKIMNRVFRERKETRTRRVA